MIDTLTLDDEYQSAKRARAFISARLAGHDREVIENATLMVSELVTNSLRHATGAVHLTLEVADDIVRVEVNDAGPALPVMRTPTPADPTGRGLQIVAHLSDEWGFNRTTASGNRVWFLIQLEHARSAHANEERPASRHSPPAGDSTVSAPSADTREMDQGELCDGVCRPNPSMRAPKDESRHPTDRLRCGAHGAWSGPSTARRGNRGRRQQPAGQALLPSSMARRARRTVDTRKPTAGTLVRPEWMAADP